MNAPLARVLRSYQERATTFLFERDAAVLVAPLGAGKGAAALTAIAELIRDGHRRHALVVAPKLVATTVWPQEVAATADADWIYLKVTVEGNHAPLQASPETVALWLDVDGSPRTGARMAAPADASGMGVDEIVETLSFGEIELAVLERAARELTWLSGPYILDRRQRSKLRMRTSYWG